MISTAGQAALMRARGAWVRSSGRSVVLVVLSLTACAVSGVIASPARAATGSPKLQSVVPVADGVALSFVAPTVPAGSAVTSYDWEVSTDATNVAYGPVSSLSYVGSYGNTTATSSPQTDPVAAYYGCGNTYPCWYQLRAVLDDGASATSWSPWIRVLNIAAPEVTSVVPVADGVALSFVAPSGSTPTSYDWEVSTDATNVAYGPVSSLSYVGSYGNTTATSSPQTDPVAAYYGCGNTYPCWYRIRADFGSFNANWSRWIEVLNIGAPHLQSAAWVPDGVALSFVAPTVPSSTAVTSYDWEVSTDGSNVAYGPVSSLSYVGSYGNTTATSSPQTDPVGAYYGCGNTDPCWYRMRADFGAFTANWSPWCLVGTACSPNATVTFDPNGGTGSMAPETAAAPAPLTTNAFTRAGYTFSGWNVLPSGAGTGYADGATYSFAVDVTLYAQWKRVGVTATVTFQPNGGSGTMAPQTRTGSGPLNFNTFTKNQYAFDTWNTAPDGSGIAYDDGATYSFASNITLYAQWVDTTGGTVIFDANGGTGSMLSQFATIPTALTANAFIRAGYAFVDWNTRPAGTGTPYADTAIFPFSTVKTTTLYAQWAATPIPTVAFSANGGTGTMAPQASNTPAPLTLNSFSRAGYLFAGWNSAPDNTGVAYANGATYPFSVSQTLYAQWSIDGPGLWKATGNLGVNRAFGKAVRLPNGKVLVAGGETGGTTVTGYLKSAELYDPDTGKWSATGSMAYSRYQFAMVLLPTGKVLAVGGYGGGLFRASAELYDPATGTWSSAGSVGTPRAWTTATLLQNGKVLVAGGDNDGAVLASAKLYDPSTNTWSTTGTMKVAFYNHTATLLPNGKVLVTGGQGQANGGAPIAKAELYDPATGTWSLTTPLSGPRGVTTATLLPNGKVLLAGGAKQVGSGYLATAVLYDPATGQWSDTGSMHVARSDAAAGLLPNGKVLITGGKNASPLASAELYDPNTGTFSTTASMQTARRRFSRIATLLANGTVLVQGGYNTTGFLKASEIYTP